MLALLFLVGIHFACRSGLSEKSASSPHLTYQVLIEDTASQTAHVRCCLSSLSRDHDRLDLVMRSQFNGARRKHSLIDGEPLAVDGQGNPLPLEKESAFHWSLQTDGAAELTLTYRVAMGAETASGADGYGLARPYVEADHGLLPTASLLLVPQGLGLSAIWIDFVLPLGWEVHCPWQRLDGDTYSLMSAAEVTDSLAAVGNWRSHELAVGGMKIHLLFAPGQKKLEAKAVPLIEKMVRSALSVFGVVPRSSYYFVFKKPAGYKVEALSKDGALLMVAGSRPDGSVPLETVAGTMTGLFFRTWGASRFTYPESMRFLQEGFAAYYALLLQAREEIITWQEFGEALGHRIALCERLASSSTLSLLHAGMGATYSTDPEARTLLEQGGVLAAALLDARIRRARPGRDLDDFMRTLINDQQWAPGEDAPCFADFLDTVRVYAGEEFSVDLDKLIREPFDLDPLRRFPAAGIPVERSREEIKPLLGGSLDGTLLTDLEPEGLAFRIGVRPGDRFRQVNGVTPVYAGDVYTAWARPSSGRIELVLDREGNTVRIDAPVPEEVTYTVHTDPWTFEGR